MRQACGDESEATCEFLPGVGGQYECMSQVSWCGGRELKRCLVSVVIARVHELYFCHPIFASTTGAQSLFAINCHWTESNSEAFALQ